MAPLSQELEPPPNPVRFSPPEGLSFLAGELSATCFNEVRRCYLDGSDMAVVLLCLAYVERELAADLYGAGWKPAKNTRLGELLAKAHEDGVLSDFEWHTSKELAGLRNSHAHFPRPGRPAKARPGRPDRRLGAPVRR